MKSTLPVNRVLLVLVLLALASLWGLDYASVQPNRIVPGAGQSLLSALGWPWASVLTLLLVICAFTPARSSSRALLYQLMIVALLLLQLPLSLAWFIEQHVDPALPYARAGIGAGFWVLLFLLGLMLIEIKQRLNLHAGWSLLIWLLMLLTILACASWLEPLALMREYQTRSPQFSQALRSHLAMVGGAVGFSLVSGFMLALLLNRYPVARKSCFGVLSFIQTIPSLALFGLLIAPLSYLSANSPMLQQLNVRGIGWAPALLALIAYSLLPMVRNTFIALHEVSADVLESARGMGMSPIQVFMQVRLPLALPIIIEGVRITTIQAIGLTAVAALIGAGGFGTFIFQGLGQAAMDLILLGALPIIVLALLADAFFSAVAARFKQGVRE
ncbi:ABC transporter permease [Nitrincola sp. MINF-07-Sa-05]|uniref:ABC transporter permease n=1 Tax=Nitrincola salilacus TaxID=3400273 RepID=UPI003917C847